jgi:Ras-related GTP-binding protein A/B
MGSEGVGKTSMHSVIFANYPAKDTSRIGYTTDRSEQKFKFMGNLTLNLWDCGGQKNFMRQYFTTYKETIFKNVEVLIYVFDVDNDAKMADHLSDFQEALQNLRTYSPTASVFVLVHKMDKIKESEKAARYNNKKEIIGQKANERDVTVRQFFGTSIWDETLYQAWSQIVQLLIPNMGFIKQTLK